MKRALVFLCALAVAAVIAEQWDTPGHIADPLGDPSVVPTGKLGTTTITLPANTDTVGSLTFETATSGPGTMSAMIPSCANGSPIIYRAAEGWACLSSSNPLPVTATSILTNKVIGTGGE